MSSIQARRNGRFAALGSALAVALLFCSVGTLVAASAQGQEEADQEYWVQRYETLRGEVEELRTRVDMLETDYSKSKRRNYPRGAELDDLLIRLEKSRKELAEKEEAWANFPDEARRAGALPGWFRD